MNNSKRYGVCLQMSSKPIYMYLKMYIYIYIYTLVLGYWLSIMFMYLFQYRYKGIRHFLSKLAVFHNIFDSLLIVIATIYYPCVTCNTERCQNFFHS